MLLLIGGFILITPVALFLGVLSGGAGHGDYVLAKILFPYTMLLAQISGTISPILVIIAILQFPAYGILTYIFSEPRRRYGDSMIMMLMVVHVCLAMYACMNSGNF
jgi:hypothetical protein